MAAIQRFLESHHYDFYSAEPHETVDLRIPGLETAHPAVLGRIEDTSRGFFSAGHIEIYLILDESNRLSSVYVEELKE